MKESVNMKNANIILVPAYEPDNRLVKLVTDLSKEGFDIVVINDGSGPFYKEIFDKCKDSSTVISYDVNEGKGYALKTGLKYIKDNYEGNYIVVTMDCDGQHTIIDAKKLIRECQSDRKNLYLGKRIRSDKTPFRSRLGNSITRFVFKLVSGLDVYDTQTGLRAFSDELTNYLLEIEGNRFEYEMNVLLSCAKDKVKIKEVEIETIYIDNNSGSHFNGIKDSYRIYRDIFKFVFKRRKTRRK